MSRRKIIIGSAALVLATVGYLLFSFSRPTKPLAVSVAFLGYTNDPAGEGVAAFTITNGSGSRVRRWDRYQIEIHGRPRLSPVFQGPNVVLDSGQSEVLTIPVPTNASPWRVRFTCSSYGSRQVFADWANRSGY